MTIHSPHPPVRITIELDLKTGAANMSSTQPVPVPLLLKTFRAIESNIAETRIKEIAALNPQAKGEELFKLCSFEFGIIDQSAREIIFIDHMVKLGEEIQKKAAGTTPGTTPGNTSGNTHPNPFAGDQHA